MISILVIHIRKSIDFKMAKSKLGPYSTYGFMYEFIIHLGKEWKQFPEESQELKKKSMFPESLSGPDNGWGMQIMFICT